MPCVIPPIRVFSICQNNINLCYFTMNWPVMPPIIFISCKDLPNPLYRFKNYFKNEARLPKFYGDRSLSTCSIPHPFVPSAGIQLSRSFSLTSTLVISGYLESRQAIAPDTTGVAMEVPLFAT